MATRGDSCVKRDVCTFYGCGSTSDLCADCGHYLSETVKTSHNSAIATALRELQCALDFDDIGMVKVNIEQVIERLNNLSVTSQ